MPLFNPAEIEVEDEGVLVGTRHTIDFVGLGVVAVDDPPNNRVVVTISGAGGGGAGQPVEHTKSTDDVSSNTVTLEFAIHRAVGAESVTAVYYTPRIAVVGSDVNNATLTVRRRDGAGGAAVVVASLLTNVASGGMVAFIPKSLGAITNPALAVGELLTFEIAKGGPPGVIIPAGVLSVVF